MDKSMLPPTPEAVTIGPVLVDVKRLMRALATSPERRGLALIAAGLVLSLLGNLTGQIWLNIWNRHFFEALEKRDVAAFWLQLGVFLGIVALLLAMVVGQTFLRERLKIALRSALVRHLKDKWLRFPVIYHLGFEGVIGENPDQRIQEDTRNLADITAELGVGALQAVLALLTFIGVLWHLSAAIKLPIGGAMVEVPGYMVWCALLYAGIGSGLTWLVGRPLIALNAFRAAREADFRFALVRVNENAEAIGSYRGEREERRVLDARFDEVRSAMRALSSSLARLTWITSGYGWLALVVPIVVASPGFFAGAITFGVLMQASDAFTHVQSALRWFVDQFAKLADWRAALHRVAGFEAALNAADQHISMQKGGQGVRVLPATGADIRLDGLTIALPDGSPVLARTRLTLPAGQRILVTGLSGIGKSTLMRVLAGLWPWGEGAVHLPEGVMILPQRPYLPLGTLRDAVIYPAAANAFTQEEIAAALRRVGLGAWISHLDEVARWDKALSLGEQQRLAFARLLLHKPGWALLDEATAALDETAQAEMLALFGQELAGVSLLNIAHRPGLERFHTAHLRLIAGERGAVMSYLELSDLNNPQAQKVAPLVSSRIQRIKSTL